MYCIFVPLATRQRIHLQLPENRILQQEEKFKSNYSKKSYTGLHFTSNYKENSRQKGEHASLIAVTDEENDLSNKKYEQTDEWKDSGPSHGHYTQNTHVSSYSMLKRKSASS